MENCFIEEKVKKYAVRISTIGKAPSTGSGILLETGSKDWVYILSALHVLKDWFVYDYDFNMRFFYPNQEGKESFLITNCRREVELCYIPVKGIPESYQLESGDFDCDQFEEYYEKTYRDIVLIRIARTKLKNPKEKLAKIRWILSDDIDYKTSFLGWGFSGASKTPVLHKSYLESKLTEENRLHMVYTKNYNGKFSDMLSGFSGTGLLHPYSEEEMVLCGVVTGCLEEEQNDRYYAVSPEVLLSVLKSEAYQSGEHPWEYSEDWIFLPLQSLMDQKILTLKDSDVDDMESESMQEKLTKKYEKFAHEHPIQELKRCYPPYDVGRCNMKKEVCPHYWYGTFWANLTENTCNQKGKKHIPVEYICSEIDQDENTEAFVGHLKTSGKVSAQIKKDSILVWQSKRIPKKGTCSKEKYKRIIGHITDSDKDTRKKGHDALEGDSEPQFALIHTAEIYETIEKCEKWKDAEKKIRGLVDDVWR